MPPVTDKRLRLRCTQTCFTVLVVVALAVGPVRVRAQDAEAPDPAPSSKSQELFASISWIDGPGKAELGSIAEINLPEGYRFTGAEGAKKWAELTANVPHESCLGVLVPESMEWFITFEYDPVGYVSDEEKSHLDGNAILESIRTGTEKSNAYRRQRGWPDMKVHGWKQPPFYDQATNHLIWSIRGGDGTEEVINHNTRFLGRSGVMSANLVVRPDSVDAVVPVVQTVFGGFNFKQGQRYAEWRSGDKVAAYGLSALIVGGGTAIAAKTGLLAKFGKAIAIGVVTVGAWLSRLIFGNKKQAS